MKKVVRNNTVYYTIVSKDTLSIKNISNDAGRLETVQAQYVLNNLLKLFGLENMDVYKTDLGKPYFKDSNIYFNYSHSKNYIACAISLIDIGIDIEEADRHINNSIINACNLKKKNKLAELITREAYCKLTGKGIAEIFNEENFINVDSYCKIITTNEYICSICTNVITDNIDFISIK